MMQKLAEINTLPDSDVIQTIQKTDEEAVQALFPNKDIALNGKIEKNKTSFLKKIKKLEKLMKLNRKNLVKSNQSGKS